MDWPERSIWSRIVWTWMRLTTRPAHAARRPGHAALYPSDRIERLHSLCRQGGRPPLFVITVMDRDGHVLDAAACDPEEYAEYR